MTVRESAGRLVRPGEAEATPNQDPLGAPATVSPASAAEHKQDDENDQQGFHVFLFGEEKQGDRLLERTDALSLLVVHTMESHLGLMPWGLNHQFPGFAYTYDRSGIYKLENSIYKSIHPEGKWYTPAEIPDNVTVIPDREFIDAMSGALQFPLDPRDGSDPLEGWYKFDSKDMQNNPFQNGLCDFYENNNITFIYYYTLMGMPVDPWLAKDVNDPKLFFSLGGDRFQLTKDLLEQAFGDVVDVRYGGHTGIPGHTKHEIEVGKIC